ncbi:MAG: hypothetical protein B6241_07140 [Spirochaetaceae bacterium 4572_59]|nr:MAG: hypothetical protein B6241_07140 [Spirochaetaceae bacterium 4572_59]
MNKIVKLTGILSLCLSAFLYGAEQKESNYSLSFNEDEAAWQLQYGHNGTMRSLFEDSDPATTYLQMILDGRNYHLQKNSFFNQHLEEYPGLIILHWSNKILHVTQSVQVDNQIKGFKVNISVRNLSKNYISVGLKQIIDTFNNTGDADFLINGDNPVDAEKSWTDSEVPAYWGTNPLKNDNFQVSFTSYGDRKPDQLIFSNWKRLSDSDWSFKTREGRNFSLLPYSINDSAAGIFYNPISIPPGTEISVQYALTVGGPALTLLELETEKQEITIPSPVPVSDKSLILNYSFQYDLDLIDDFINEINTLLHLENPVYNTQIEYYLGELEKLKQKLSYYEDIQ